MVKKMVKKTVIGKNEYSHWKMGSPEHQSPDNLRRRRLSGHQVTTCIVATNQIKDLEEQRNLIEERRQVLKKLEQDEIKAQVKLSIHASVTSIIPDLNDQTKKSGHIDKEKKVVEKLELGSKR